MEPATAPTWYEQLFVAPVQSLLTQLSSSTLNLLKALLILLVGWWIAKAIEAVVVRILKAIAIDKIAEQIQLAQMLAKGGIRRKVSELVGAIIYWIIMLLVVVIAFNALELEVAAQLFGRVVEFLPRVVGSVFMLIVGVFLAVFLATTVRTAASNSGILQAHLLGQTVQTFVVVLTIVAALEQLGFEFVPEVFLIILGGISLGCALAFGLGCKDVAGKWVSNLIEQIQGRKR